MYFGPYGSEYIYLGGEGKNNLFWRKHEIDMVGRIAQNAGVFPGVTGAVSVLKGRDRDTDDLLSSSHCA